MSDDIHRSAARYEDWLRRRLGAALVESDLQRKHDKMRQDKFSFLRATYWRWAETVRHACPDAAAAPAVLAVGDIHLENFGTWRDADGRLAWGVNDFDEAAEMPYTLDLIRLATSAVVAASGADKRPEPAAAADAILEGYRAGLAEPRPLILDRDLAWLRALVVVPEKERARFWRKLDDARPEPAPADYRSAIASAMPEPGLAFETARRTAGCGSLGRPRWIGIADWRGGPLVREAKALLPSAWALAGGEPGAAIRCGEIAGGRHRAPDPWFRIAGSIAVRRLSPDNRKIEAEGDKGGDAAALLDPPMLQAMGRDLAGVHLGTGDRGAAVARDLAGRKDGWLAASAGRMAELNRQEHADWKSGKP